MKSRQETAEFINNLEVGSNPKQEGWHFGMLDLRDIMDFIYEGKPASKDEEIRWNGRQF